MPSPFSIPPVVRECLVTIGSAASIAVFGLLVTGYRVVLTNSTSIEANKAALARDRADIDLVRSKQIDVMQELSSIRVTLTHLKEGQKDISDQIKGFDLVPRKLSKR